ncbi:hypothetical protein [Wenxinia marina]|uniref:Uncharacterized protein n=1 Tax=Wenxinia marina DSM 24838 TaxID=1123501 RepID=A0A0D0NR04_9RHOB|nr:hypothetical protein [Wenxinia marina]KIQ70655.1 hypothetical protein Wenmar_01033 [Wenxinia marina DSM 24838]GGL51449.1 hypothetical protein GCM10011392_02180 [Wenxinia marina]
MTDPATAATLEGRLLAQRKVLARIVAELKSPALDAYLADRDHFEGYDEDPGAVPDDGFSIEGAISDELRLIRELAEAMRAR